MKKTTKNFDLSDDLFYMDQIGTLEDQLAFLDSLNIHDAQFVKMFDHQEYCTVIIQTFDGKTIVSRMITIFPYRDMRRKHFGGAVVDLFSWFTAHGFERIHTVSTFKTLLLCEEDHSDGEEATVPVVD